MVNLNGSIVESENLISFDNRGYKFGDGLFETLKVVSGTILFWEDHYFRMMASMRILRMEIPLEFTMEFLESEVKKVLEALNLNQGNARVRISVDRGEGGAYLPLQKKINYFISAIQIEKREYEFISNRDCRVDLYKDYFVPPGILSSIKSSCKNLNVLASIFAKENNFQNCLLLNTNKNITEATNSNIFLVSGNTIKTPPINDGCLNGIIRKQIIAIIKSSEDLDVIEESISPFELQKADELFLTNISVGIQPITHYRKKEFNTSVSQKLLKKLNEKVLANCN